MARERFKKVKIAFEIETCGECPFVRTARTLQAGMAYDYHCGYGYQPGSLSESQIRRLPKIMSYVEYSSDENPVPEWCKIRV